jgi:hypothetical protein
MEVDWNDMTFIPLLELCSLDELIVDESTLYLICTVLYGVWREVIIDIVEMVSAVEDQLECYD